LTNFYLIAHQLDARVLDKKMELMRKLKLKLKLKLALAFTLALFLVLSGMLEIMRVRACTV